MRWPRYTHVIKPTTVTKEHLKAKHHNGTDDISNLAAACSRCNVMRGHMDIDVFRSILTKLFTIEYIKQNWHSTEPNVERFIRKIFQYEVDVALAHENEEAAARVVTRRHKYSVDELAAMTTPFEEIIPLVH